MYTVSYSKQAQKTLHRLPRNTAQLIQTKLMALAADPHGMGNVKKLTDHPGYRLRVGDWRVVYILRDDAQAIQVIHIDVRGSIYQ